jgi:hypothetical protein
MPQALAMAAERSNVVIDQASAEPWEYPQAVAAALGWEGERVREVNVSE